MKFFNVLGALITAIFAVIGTLLFVLLVYFGLSWVWDYAISNFGDLGVGFMMGLSVLAIIWLLIDLTKSFFGFFYKPKTKD